MPYYSFVNLCKYIEGWQVLWNLEGFVDISLSRIIQLVGILRPALLQSPPSVHTACFDRIFINRIPYHDIQPIDAIAQCLNASYSVAL